MPDRGDARFDKCQLTVISNELFYEGSFRYEIYKCIEKKCIEKKRGVTIEEIVTDGHPLSKVRHSVKCLCADGKINIEG